MKILVTYASSTGWAVGVAETIRKTLMITAYAWMCAPFDRDVRRFRNIVEILS
ncbi:MAG: flavodoxin family protein [Chloroflexi bacterium]|nr:flavodoxin family protein [Chloroflexota bacterium]